MTEPSRDAYAALERELAARTAELDEAQTYAAAISEVLRVIGESPDNVQPVFDVIAEQASALCAAKLCLVGRFDGELIHVAALHGASPEMTELIAATYPAKPAMRPGDQQAILTRAPVESGDFLAEPSYDTGTREALRSMGVRSGYAVPLLRRGECLGAIAVARAERGLFPRKLVNLLNTFAEQAVIAIENARLFHETQQALAHQTATSEVLRVISSSVADTAPVFEKIIESCGHLVRSELTLIGLTRADGKVHLVAQRGMTAEAAQLMQPMTVETSLTGLAIREGRTLHYPQVDESIERVRAVRTLLGIIGQFSLVVAPLLWEGRGVGSIILLRHPPKPFSDQEIALLTTFADQAVIAIENARLFNETQEALEQQTATAEILRVISSSPTDLQPVYDAIAERARALCGAHVGGVTRFDGERVHLAALHGISHEGTTGLRTIFPTQPGRGSTNARVILEGAPVQNPDVYADATYKVTEAARKARTRSGLAVPLLRDGQVIGTIWVGREAPGPFSDKLVTLLQTFAAQAVIAIENVRLFNETKEALERQTAMSEVLRVISESPTDVQPVFDAIVERAVALCHAEFGIATRFDGEWLSLQSAHGLTGEQLIGIRANFPTKLGRGTISARAVVERAIIQVPDVQADADYEMKEALQGVGRSAVAVPLLREGRVLGVIAIGRTEVGYFPDNLVSLLQAFADQAVIAIENVRLFNEITEALEQQTAISDILRVTTESPTDVQPVLEAIADHAVRLCEAVSASIFLIEANHLRHVTSRGPLADQAVPLELLPIDRTSTSGRAILERRTVQVDDMQSEAVEFPRGHEIAHRLGHRTIVVAPLFREGKPFGTIVLRRQEVRPFSARDQSLLRTFADQAAIALENVRLFNETNEALEQHTATAEVLRVIGSSVADTQPVFEKIVDSCRQLFGPENVAIFLVGDDSQLELRAGRGPAIEQGVHLYPRPLAGTIHELAFRAGHTVHYPSVPSINRPPDVQAVYDAVGDHSVMVAPMLWEGRGIGTIAIACMPPRPFTDKQISLLTTFADQAVIAIQNARLFNETQEALARQTATAEILRVISSSPTDVQPVFNAIARLSMGLCEGRLGVTTRFDGECVHLMAVHGISNELIRTAHSAFPMTLERDELNVNAVLSRTPAHLSTGSGGDGNWKSPLRTVLQQGAINSAVAVPMLRHGQAIGTIFVGRSKTERVPDKLVQLLQTFADQAVIAIENVRLFNETQEALSSQTATADILRVISGSPTDAAPVFDAIVKTAVRLIACEMAFMMRCDATTISVEAAAARDGVRRDLALLAMPIDPTVNFPSRAVVDKSTYYIPDWSALPLPPHEQQIQEKFGLKSALYLPLLRDGDCIGLLTFSSARAHGFGAKEIALAESFRDQALIAIENARLFNETQEALEQQTSMAEILRVIGSSVADTQPVFDKILESCLNLFEVEDIGIFLLRDTKELDLVAKVGPFMARVADVFPQPVAGTIQAQALRARSPIQYSSPQFGSDLPSDVRFVRDNFGEHTAIVAPMLWEGREIGNIVLGRVPPRPFSAQEVALLGTFADQAAIAIENARLFHDIQDKSQQLAIANQHKSEFLANMSHELRTPLNAIIGFSEVLLEGMFGELNEKQADYLTDIFTSGKHLLSLINDILDLSKIEAGRMELELSTFDVAAAISNAMTLIRERAIQHGVELKLEVVSGLGERRADERKFKQILLNLLSNAVKFTPDGGRIDVRATDLDEDVLQVSVSDTGIGIAPADQATVFEEFRQVGRHYTNKQEGTGLGLALTRRFVELHGGTLSLHSTPGEGSTFTFTIPRQQE